MTMTYSTSYAATGTSQIQVGVIDHVGHVDGLAAFLPLRWATRHYDSLYEVAGFDVLVLGGATPRLVAGARLIHPDAAIVAVIATDAPASLFVATLQAGADTCVRAGVPAVLAGHLLATHRRRARQVRRVRRRR
jgi:hypothetical protein